MAKPPFGKPVRATFAGANPRPLGYVGTVNVRPTSDVIRQILRHVPQGTGFSENPEGTAWPDDPFTWRRIRDGDIEVVPPVAPAPPPEAPVEPVVESAGPVKFGDKL